MGKWLKILQNETSSRFSTSTLLHFYLHQKWKIINCTAKNSVTSPHFLVWKFGGKAWFPPSFGRFARNYVKTVTFHKISTPGKYVKLLYFFEVLTWRNSKFFSQDRDILSTALLKTLWGKFRNSKICLLSRNLSTPASRPEYETLHKKRSFPLRISSVTATKSTGNFRFGHIYRRNP